MTFREFAIQALDNARKEVAPEGASACALVSIAASLRELLDNDNSETAKLARMVEMATTFQHLNGKRATRFFGRDPNPVVPAGWYAFDHGDQVLLTTGKWSDYPAERSDVAEWCRFETAEEALAALEGIK